MPCQPKGKRTSLFRPVTLSLRRIWSRLPFSCALRGGTERRSDAGAFSCILTMLHRSLLRKILPVGFPFYDLWDVLFYFAFMLPPKPVNVNINFLTSLTLTDKINIYHSSFGEKMTVPHATKRSAFRFFGCLIFSIAAESTLFQSFFSNRDRIHILKRPLLMHGVCAAHFCSIRRPVWNLFSFYAHL